MWMKITPRHPGFHPKMQWLRQRTTEGLRQIVLLDDQKKIGFVEFIPGEHAWRAVDASDYMFIHCLWIYPKKYQKQGFGKKLIDTCIQNAESQKMKGVAVIVSSKGWLAGKDLFIQNGFSTIDQRGKFELLAKKFETVPDPSFSNSDESAFPGLHLLYADQCPMCERFVMDIRQYCNEKHIGIEIKKIETARDARLNPGIYGTFSLIYQGKVVADHPISRTRFQNIVHKELHL
jgi:N-acetylglutamate synthase-like GNAT family acetyltransferase